MSINFCVHLETNGDIPHDCGILNQMEQHLCFSVEEILETGNDQHQTAKPAVQCVQGAAQNEVRLLFLFAHYL